MGNACVSPGVDVTDGDRRGKASEELLEVSKRSTVTQFSDFGEKILLRSLPLASMFEDGEKFGTDLHLIIPPGFEVMEKDHWRITLQFNLVYLHIQSFPEPAERAIKEFVEVVPRGLLYGGENPPYLIGGKKFGFPFGRLRFLDFFYRRCLDEFIFRAPVEEDPEDGCFVADRTDISDSRPVVYELLNVVGGNFHQEAFRRPLLPVEFEEVVEDFLIPLQSRRLPGGLDRIQIFLDGLHDGGGLDLPADVSSGEFRLHLGEIPLGEARLGEGDLGGLLDPFPVDGVLDPEGIPPLIQGSHGGNIPRLPPKSRVNVTKM